MSTWIKTPTLVFDLAEIESLSIRKDNEGKWEYVSLAFKSCHGVTVSGPEAEILHDYLTEFLDSIPWPGDVPEDRKPLPPLRGRIDMIASGYEWICPHCHTPNNTSEVAALVTCEECQWTFDANLPEHAYE